MSERCDLLVMGCGAAVTLAPGAPAPIRGTPSADELGVLKGPVAVAMRDGTILAVGPEGDVLAAVDAAHTIDAEGRVALPGFVDPHTHPVFVGTREGEFEARCSGKPYQEIAAGGGGIRASVRRLRAAAVPEIEHALRQHLDSLLLHGVTTAEVKSGYGLSLESELASLRAIARVGIDHPLRLVSTFLGAHEFPDEYRDDPDAYVDLVVDTMIPAVAAEGLARYCDVFCEEGVFTAEQSERVLTAAAAHGLALRLHADEFAASGGAELAAAVGAHSADHLGAATENGLAKMLAADVVPVLLPGTSFYLGLPAPKVRWMLEHHMPVALGTDFNPGSSMTSSPQMIWTLACVQYRMSPAEALVGLTVNAAHALRLADQVGRLAPGYRADLILCDVENWRYVPYHFGVNHVDTVIVRGKVAVEGRRLVR